MSRVDPARGVEMMKTRGLVKALENTELGVCVNLLWDDVLQQREAVLPGPPLDRLSLST